MNAISPSPPPIGEASMRPAPEAVSTPDAPSSAPAQSFSRVLNRLAREVDRGERVVRTALRGNLYADDTRGMIALQAGVYRYVEAVELCTKLVDRAAGAVRTTLQSQ